MDTWSNDYIEFFNIHEIISENTHNTGLIGFASFYSNSQPLWVDASGAVYFSSHKGGVLTAFRSFDELIVLICKNGFKQTAEILLRMQSAAEAIDQHKHSN